jgi:hypothetical protein
LGKFLSRFCQLQWFDFLFYDFFQQPVPGGVFSPIFVSGAAVGRLYGEFTDIFCSFFSIGSVNVLGYSGDNEASKLII